MSQDPVAARYAQALLETAKAQQAVAPAREQLQQIGSLMDAHKDLAAFLGNPDVEPEQKLGVLEHTVSKGWVALVRDFLLLVLRLGRAESLRAMVDAFEAAVDADEGRLAVVVRSAHPLSETVLHRIARDLERRERKTITVRAEVAPELIGGMQIRLDHRVIDASVRRQLDDLRERLRAVRVY